MNDDYPERLFAHYVAGQWRAPFATTLIPVHLRDGRLAGQIVPASGQDVARAHAALRPVTASARQRFATLLMQQADTLADALGEQGAQPATIEILRLANAIGADCVAAGPALLMRDVRADPAGFGHVLGMGLSGGVIYCPFPQDALFATCLAHLASQADMTPGAFNLLHANVVQTRDTLQQVALTPV